MEWRNEYEYTLRLNYDLNEKSIVFDLGGYLGWFTEQINNKYHSQIYCFEPIGIFHHELKSKFDPFNNIKVFKTAISDINGKSNIYINYDESSMFIQKGMEYEIDCITLDRVLEENQIDKIDLIEINIEGSEYPVLEYMIRNNLVSKCDNIQVQFHEIGDNFYNRYISIKHELEKTHKLTYHFPFVWENWEKI